ncbi:MAG: hypothetical protein CMJ34_01550 [Phycisphaerae bacterium]|nr:hypothetical protein [Phycisphaerae bacterium]
MRHSFASSCAPGPVARRSGILGILVSVMAVAIGGFVNDGASDMTEDVGETDRRPSAMSLTDLLELRTIREVVVDPEGRFAVITIESFDRDPDAEGPLSFGDCSIRRHLHRVDLLDPAVPTRQLTFGKRRDGSPRISPDGRTLAFVRSGEQGEAGDDDGGDDPSRRSQVWTMPLEGGGEASPVTGFKHGASGPRWSPDGSRLVVETRLDLDDLVTEDGPPSWPVNRPGLDTHPVPAAERAPADPGGTPEQIAAWLQANADDSSPRVIDRLDFLGEREVEEIWRPRQVMLVDVDGSDDPVRLGRGIVDRSQPIFSTDGRSVIMVTSGGERHPEDNLDSRLEIIEVGNPGSSRSLFDQTGWSVAGPVPGEDGSLVAFLARQTDEPGYRGTRIGLIPVGGGDPIWVTDGVHLSVEEVRWGPRAATVTFTAPHEGAVPLFNASPSMLEPTSEHRVREGLPSQVHAFDITSEALVWIESSAGAPSRLWCEQDGVERLLLDPNPWIAERIVARPTEDRVKRPDGASIQYWVLPPSKVGADGKAPLMLAIHGGPMAMWGPAEPTMWLEWQLASARGYGVVYANPRGSGGYGEAFQRGNHQNWGPGPGGDCLAALDEACREPWVDTDRLVVTGGSYGGYLTSWIIAHDHRFKAAVAQRGVYDLATFFGEGNAYRLVEWAFGGNPHDPRFTPLLDRSSPFRHAGSIETPLLIMHGEQDLRTGTSQASMLYRALRVDGRPVELVLYPKADHDLSRSGDPIHRMDRIGRILEFFSRFASPEDPSGPKPSSPAEEARTSG